jgi:hypothetical protein
MLATRARRPGRAVTDFVHAGSPPAFGAGSQRSRLLKETFETDLGPESPGPLSCTLRAPAWGATHRTPSPWRLGRRFDPRPRVGGDAAGEIEVVRVFCFNPRPRVGGDSSSSSDRNRPCSFQSAPPRGGRLVILVG